ncbi:MAG: ABC transporter ATP-binding protein [Clostridia bacterium]|nr:ABC transporter ATP-binding protein [Clostridia bacterium]MBQ7224870.1 ABC transporter ATP-binding protein [Clostridia bacterium]MBR6773075.1 ABC transporter ATP-binding protein [Clostridia bacterium]MBR7141512.1 ABC transporter ATP-binding protein [Clostridia bacterium]
MDILTINGVDLTYQSALGETQALKDFSLTVKSGEFVSLVGPSGCGKTTVLSLIAGLISPSSGEILLGGKKTGEKANQVGYMLQRDQLFEWRTILDNVLLGAEIQKKRNSLCEDYAKNLLEKYGLQGFTNRYPRELSGGMRQRVALIRTLVLRPEILLLDEPFSALDFQTRLSVCDDVYSIIKSENKTAILVTHDISEAISMSDRVVVLSARPATVKKIFTLNFGQKTPLLRRESAQFPVSFDEIYKEVKT